MMPTLSSLNLALLISLEDVAMTMNATDILAPNPLRLAYDFMAEFTLDQTAAIGRLPVMLDGMDEWQVRRWFDHLAELLVEEETPAETWHALFSALETLN